MFGVRTSQVFTSRWKALLWSLGVLTTAYCTIPAADYQSPPATVASTQGSGKPGQPNEQEMQARDALKALQNIGKE